MSTSTLSVHYQGRLGQLLLNVRFSLPAKGVIGIFGPSGCGKSTLLRCLAGLSSIPGNVQLGEDTIQAEATGFFLPPHQRRIGYVFQEANLFPHLSVRENLAYGWKRRAQPNAAPPTSWDEVIDLLQLESLLARQPGKLSGGERQRVAIGRALLSQPRLLLMDEPLAALDAERKEEILPYLEALHGAGALPILYVTHEMAELERLADSLVLLQAGRSLASGPLAELQADPKLPLLQRSEASVVLEAQVTQSGGADGIAVLEFFRGQLEVAGTNLTRGRRCRVRLRASDVSLARERAEDSTILNILPAKILAASPQDAAESQLNVRLALGTEGDGARIISRVTRKSWERLGLRPGQSIYAQIKSVAVLARPTAP